VKGTGGEPTATPPPPATAGSRMAAAVERYVQERFAQEDPLLERIREEMAHRGLPTIQVPAVTGAFLALMVRISRPGRVLEVGTLAGYSALWIARALPPEGHLLTLERNPEHAQLARSLLARDPAGARVEVREGEAGELLPGLEPDGGFQMVFVDADKERLPFYLEEAARLLSPGGLLLVDNVLWRGAVLEEAPEEDGATRAIQAFNDAVARDHRFTSATIVPVGDGVLVAVRG